MSKVLIDLLRKRAKDHASLGFGHLLDFEAGNQLSLTEALIEAASIPQAVLKLGLQAEYGADGTLLSVAKVQSMQGGLQNSHQKQTFIDGYKSELSQFSAETWNYFENVCLVIERSENE